MDRGQFIGGGLATIYLRELWQPALVAIERRVGGRLGVSAIEIADNGTGGRIVEHRANERFPLCSTFKMLLVSAVLAKVDAGHERLACDAHEPSPWRHDRRRVVRGGDRAER